jgi:hypothetical protein
VVFAQAHLNFQFKDCFDKIQTQVGNLTQDLDYLGAVQQFLIIPFTVAPSTKLLGTCLTTLAAKLLPYLRVEAIGLVLDGQVAIEDIRLLDWRLLADDNRRSTRVPPVSFNIDEKIINLNLEGDTEHRGLMIKFSMSKQLRDEIKETSNDHILRQCEVF